MRLLILLKDTEIIFIILEWFNSDSRGYKRVWDR